MRELAPRLSPTTLITDGGSTKRDVVAAAYRTLGNKIGQFVPGHPIAGAERSGVAAAATDLYRGKRVVFGHTTTECLPQELSQYTPDDPTDLWAGENVIGIDTGCGSGGFLTAIELPALNVYESRG